MHKTIKILLPFIIIFWVMLAAGKLSDNIDDESYGLSYLEDVSGKMDIQEVMRTSNFTISSQRKNDTLSFGNSSSTYWIRVPLSDCKQGAEYVSVYNPTVKELSTVTIMRGGTISIRL